MSLTQQQITTGVNPHFVNRFVELQAEETPAVALIPKGDPLKNPQAQHPFRDRKVLSKQGVADGDDAKGASYQDTVKIIKSENYMLDDTVKVGKKAETFVDQAGVGLGNQYKDEVDRSMSAIKVALDQVVCDTSDARAEGTDGKGSEFRGLFEWCNNGAQGYDPVPERYRTPANQISTVPVDEFTETVVQGLINSFNDNTGYMANFNVLVGINISQQVSNWSIFAEASATNNYIRRYQGDASDKRKVLTSIVSVLECVGGRAEMHSTRNLRWDRRTNVRDAFSSWSMIGWNEGAVQFRDGWSPQHEKLGKRGASKEGYISLCTALCADPTKLIKYQPTALT